MCKKTTTTHTLCVHRSAEITHCKASLADPPKKCKAEVRQVFEHSLCERCRDPDLTATISTTIAKASLKPLHLQTQRSDIGTSPYPHSIPPDHVAHVNDVNSNMSDSTRPPDIPKGEKRNVFGLFRSKGRKVKIAPNAFNESSDEGLSRISRESNTTSTRLSGRSDDVPSSLDRGLSTKNGYVATKLPENRVEEFVRRGEGRRSDETRIRDRVESTKSEGNSKSIGQVQAEIEPREAVVEVFNYNESWNTNLADGDRIPIGSEIDMYLNPERLGSLDLAHGYQKIIGEHPYEIEFFKKPLALKEKGELAKEEQHAVEAMVRDEAILQKKRRQWQEKKEADGLARHERKEREAAEAIAAPIVIDEELARARRAEARKAERYKEHARQREEARKKRESDVSALTTWTGFVKGASELAQQSQHMRIAAEKINAKKTSPEEIEAERSRTAKEKIRQNHQAALRHAEEEELQKQQATKPFPRPRISQEISSSQTRLSGEKLKAKAKTWTGNLMGYKEPKKHKVLPLTYMRDGRWVGEDGLPDIGELARATEMAEVFRPFTKGTKIGQEDLWPWDDEQQSPMEHSLSKFAPSNIYSEVQPLFGGNPQPSDGLGPSFESPGSGESAQPRSPIALTPLLKELELQNEVSEAQQGKPRNPGAVPKDVSTPTTELHASRRRQPTPSLIAADLRVGRSVDARHAWRIPRENMGPPAE